MKYVCAVILLSVSLQASAQELRARARVDSTQYLVGDWITVDLELVHPDSMTIHGVVHDSLAGYVILSQSALKRLTPTTTGARIVASKYSPGESELPPFSFLVSSPYDSLPIPVRTNSLLLTVNAVAVDTAGEIRDIKDPLSLPWSLQEILLVILLLLVVGALAFFLFRYFRNKKQVVPEEYAPSLQPAHVVALNELGMLKEKKLWQRGEIKGYYSELSEIIRRYFENRFGIMALEYTTEEIMVTLRNHRDAMVVDSESDALLRQADLVKFAKFSPGATEHEEAMQSAYRIVESTRPAALEEVHAGT
jgi:hypothetical protein